MARAAVYRSWSRKPSSARPSDAPHRSSLREPLHTLGGIPLFGDAPDRSSPMGEDACALLLVDPNQLLRRVPKLATIGGNRKAQGQDPASRRPGYEVERLGYRPSGTLLDLCQYHS